MFSLQRQKTQSVLLSDGGNCHTPVGTALHYRNRGCIMRLCLGAVSRGPRAIQHAVDQNPCAASGVAVDHQTRAIRKHYRHGFFHRMVFEARVARAEYDTLQAAITGHQFQLFGQKGTIVLPTRGIHEMDAGDVALAALRRRKAARASDVQRLDRDALQHQASDQQIQTDAMTADHDKVRRLMSRPDQRNLNRRSGRQHFRLRSD